MAVALKETDLAEDKQNMRGLVNAAMYIQIPQNSGNSLTSQATISFSRITLLH
jgi:hypothetical protein